MKKYKILLLGLIALLGCASNKNAESTITWETLGNETDSTGTYYIQRFTVETDGPFDQLAFCMFKRSMEPVNDSDSLIELFPGYFAVASPRFNQASKDQPIIVDIKSKGSLKNISYAPDGMHLVVDGKAVPARNVFKSTIADPKQYVYYGKDGAIDPMIYGDEAFVINDSLRSASRPAPYGDIPTLKSVTLTGKTVALPDASKVTVEKIADSRYDYYRATIDERGLTLSTNSDNLDALVAQLLRRAANAADASGNVPAAVIEDWADLPYRALMIDVVRNFNSLDAVKSFIDLMADYGLNTLHFHVGDDEGWRVEIPELPELTEVGSRRGYCTDDNVPFLKQIYSGDGLPDSNTPANGYYTKAEFIDLLKYAHQRGIDIIPEFDTPGHSRAAIRAMEYRYKKTGDDSLRLIHDGDTSEYTTAQAYHDNTLNPALEGPYKFWDIVMGSMVDTYSEAGVPLRAIHIGGDEVAKHAWDGSDRAKVLMEKEGMTDQRELHAYFVKRVAEIAQKHGVKIMGWQEIALGHTDDYNAAVQPVVSGVNCWTNAGKYGTEMAEKGYPLILSNVDYLYFDQTPDTHPEEPGLTWGGLVDEFKPLNATVDRLCPGDEKVQANVVGISGQLFAETVRSQAMVERYILPRMLGLAERAHNIKPTLTDAEYFGFLTNEMDQWAKDGRNFYIRQPGIRINQGKVEMNEAYGKGEIRYTLDGSDPTAESTLYNGQFDLPEGTQQIRARLFYGPAKSVTSILYVD